MDICRAEKHAFLQKRNIWTIEKKKHFTYKNEKRTERKGDNEYKILQLKQNIITEQNTVSVASYCNLQYLHIC